jgi:hypothetical protein
MTSIRGEYPRSTATPRYSAYQGIVLSHQIRRFAGHGRGRLAVQLACKRRKGERFGRQAGLAQQYKAESHSHRGKKKVMTEKS